MKRKLKASPLQRSILVFLADSGDCSLTILLNNLLSTSCLSPDSFLKEIERSLRILHRAGCLFLTRQKGEDRSDVLAQEMCSLDLSVIFSRKESDRDFIFVESGVDDIVVLLTNGGV